MAGLRRLYPDLNGHRSEADAAQTMFFAHFGLLGDHIKENRGFFLSATAWFTWYYVLKLPSRKEMLLNPPPNFGVIGYYDLPRVFKRKSEPAAVYFLSISGNPCPAS
jgi:hypothetical protein